MLALFVLCLVVIDIIILGSYSAVEGSRGQLGVRNITNKENLEDVIGVKFADMKSFVLYCMFQI